jgi:hypothetical protein
LPGFSSHDSSLVGMPPSSAELSLGGLDMFRPRYYRDRTIEHGQKSLAARDAGDLPIVGNMNRW